MPLQNNSVHCYPGSVLSILIGTEKLPGESGDRKLFQLVGRLTYHEKAKIVIQVREPMPETPFGFINLNKPAGLTSHDCVAKVRRLLKIKKVGHGGTLDPAATGVLPIAVGKATRLLQFLPEGKGYRAKIRFGVKTTTDDLEGEVIAAHPVPELTLEQIKPILSQFIGQIEQIPPAYSAIQRDGKRLYELARAGKVVDVPSRVVEVNRIEILAWHPGEFPELEVDILCGGGTYIRAIARDFGEVLKVGGTLAALVRTQSCGLKLADSITLEELERQHHQGTFQPLSPDRLLQHLRAIALSSEEARRWCQGQRIAGKISTGDRTDILRVYSEVGDLLGLGDVREMEGNPAIAPKIVLNEA